MKLKKCSLINWRSLSNASLPLSNINFIFGKNNEGKSSIVYGIEYALINRTSVANNLESFQKEGTEECGTLIDIDGVGELTRYKKTAAQVNRLNHTPIPDKDIAKVYQDSFGLDYDTIAMMFDASKFTSMDKKDQKAFLLRLTGIALNASKVIEYMENPSEDAISMVNAEIGDSVLTIDDLENVYNTFYKTRRDKNKDYKDITSTLDVLKKSLPTDKPREIQFIKDELAKVIANLKEIEKNITIYNERIAQKTKLEKDIAIGDANMQTMESKLNPSIPHTQEDLDVLEKEYSQILSQKSEIDKEMGTLTSSINSVLRVLAGYNITKDSVDDICNDDSVAIVDDISLLNEENITLLNEKSEHSKELGGLDANIKSAKAMIEKLSTTKCPLSTAIECNYDKAPMLAEINGNIDKWTKRIEELTKRNEEIDVKVISNNKAILKHYKNTLLKNETSLTSLKEKIESITTKKKAIESQIKIVEWINNAKPTLDARKKELSEIQIPAIDGLMEKKKEYEDKQSMLQEEMKLAEKYLRDVELIKQTEVKREKAKASAETLDYLVKEFAPNGVRSRFLKKIIAPIVDIANKRLEILSPNYSIDFDFSKDFDILVTNKTGTLPFEQLSVSEKLRIQIIIQDAINQLKNVGLMVIDEVGLLDEENFISLLNLIKEIAASYGNIFIIGTKKKSDVVAVSEHLYNTSDDVSVFYLENNEVFKL